MAVGLNVAMTVDDPWGGVIVSAQNAHLAAGTPTSLLTGVTDFGRWTRPAVAQSTSRADTGIIRLGTEAGLGIQVDAPALGAPVIDVSI